MEENRKTKKQLIGELQDLRQRLSRLEEDQSLQRRKVNVVKGREGGKQISLSVIQDATDCQEVEERLRTLSRAIEQNPTSIVITDTEGAIEYVNPKFTELTGFSLEEAVGKNPRILKTDLTPREEFNNLWNTIRSGSTWRGKFCNKKKNGEVYWEAASISPVISESGEITHFVAVKEDITDRKRTEEELFNSRQMLQLAMDNMPLLVSWKDRNLTYLGCNSVFVTQAGLAAPSEIIGKTDFDLSWKEMAHQYRADDEQVMKSDTPKLRFEESIPQADGSQSWVTTWKIPLHDRDGNVIGIFGSTEDITERKLAELEIQNANEKLISWVNDLEQRNHEAHLLRQMGDLLQTCMEQVEYYAIVKEYAHQLFPNTSGALFITNNSNTTVEAMIVWGDRLQSESSFATKDCWALRGSKIHLVKSTTPGLACRHILNPFIGWYMDVPLVASNEIIGVLHIEGEGDDLFINNIQALALTVADHLSLSLSNLSLRETLRIQSIRDVLTGLFNRRYMEETLTRELPRAKRKKSQIGLIMLDIDHFKIFNDTFGHEAGDLVLHEMGTLLQTQIRGEDIACRFGGEEFILILPDADLEVTRQRAEAIRKNVKSMKIEYHQHPLGEITISLGVAVFPEHGSNLENILRRADEALYQAKHNGRDRVEVAQVDQLK